MASLNLLFLLVCTRRPSTDTVTFFTPAGARMLKVGLNDVLTHAVPTPATEIDALAGTTGSGTGGRAAGTTGEGGEGGLGTAPPNAHRPPGISTAVRLRSKAS